MHVTDAIMDGVHINEEMREINQMLHDFNQAFRLRSVYAAKMSKCENIWNFWANPNDSQKLEF